MLVEVGYKIDMIHPNQPCNELPDLPPNEDVENKRC